jgi:hypothetical protein
MSSRSNNEHHATLHALFVAAKEKGYTEFQLQLINEKGRIEFCISPQGHPEMNAKFEVRGNMVREQPKMGALSRQRMMRTSLMAEAVLGKPPSGLCEGSSAHGRFLR